MSCAVKCGWAGEVGAGDAARVTDARELVVEADSGAELLMWEMTG